MFRSFLALLVIQTFLVSFSELAEAVPRWRRRSANYNTYYGTGFTQIAYKIPSESAHYRPLSIQFDYDRALEDGFVSNDSLRVFLTIYEEEIRQDLSSIIAEVEVINLSNSGDPRRFLAPLVVEGEEDESVTALLELTNPADGESFITAAGVYRCFINLHRSSDDREYGADTVIGRVPGPYYVATPGPSVEAQARHHIAMRTFREWYYTELGWATDHDYIMDCHDYYLWAVSSCTVGSFNGRAQLWSLFHAASPYHDSSQIADLAERGALHGDYVRVPGHTFMLLAYDSQFHQVWTMEANYNATIEIVIREVTPGWTVGHLMHDHIVAGLFEPQGTEIGSMPDDMMPVTIEEDSGQTIVEPF